MNSRPAIRQFLRELLNAKGDTAPFSDGDSMLRSGRLQSGDAVEIIVFLEEQFGVDLADVAFDQAKIDTVESIESLIHTAHSKT